MDARDHDRFMDVGIVRLTTWATAAAVAITAAALAGLTPAGSQRAGIAFAALAGGGPRQATQLAAQRADLESDRRSLNEALRLLASDRDRLMARVGSIERNLDDITGSIKSGMSSPPMPENDSLQDPAPRLAALPAVRADARRAKPDLPEWLANVPEPWPSPSSAMEFAPGPPLAWPAPAPPVRVATLAVETQPLGPIVVSRTEFGIDIGSGSDLEELRILWKTAKAQHGRLIGNLSPIVVRREDRAGSPEYRLVLGPLVNAGAAAKLCATLGSSEVMCSTRPYQGERLTP
ncbi:MAG TPA: hypothetical protein VFK79_12275 [Xanthobacteraceae bacterium]|nr:hypothetical protein [Xanthobacteraceae bacterium]